MMRVRGGMNGLLAAIEAGICDELDANAPNDPPSARKLRGADERRALKRAARKARASRKRSALALRAPF